LETAIYYVNISILIYFFLLGAWYGLILLASISETVDSYAQYRYGNLDEIIETGFSIPITIIIPAFNEEQRILNTIRNVLKSNYKNIQILVINDGSTDGTLDLLINEFQLYEIPPIIEKVIKTSSIRHLYKSKNVDNLTVIDKKHSPGNTAADANNCGLNATNTPVYITIDADTLLEPEAITQMLLQFLAKKHCISVGGVIFVLNENTVDRGRIETTFLSEGFTSAFQGLEYVRSFTYGRSGLNNLSGSLCHPGAFTLNETHSVQEVGGYDPLNFAYDVDITMKLHGLSGKYPVKLSFSSNAISWTKVPSTLKKFWTQRDRWQRGMLRSIFTNRRMLFNPRYGFTGMIVFPAYIMFDLLGPVIEFLAYILLILTLIFDVVSYRTLGWFILLAWGYIIIMTLASFYLNLITYSQYRKLSILRIIWLVTVEMFGFRQFRAACCFFGTLHYFFNRLMGKPL